MCCGFPAVLVRWGGHGDSRHTCTEGCFAELPGTPILCCRISRHHHRAAARAAFPEQPRASLLPWKKPSLPHQAKSASELWSWWGLGSTRYPRCGKPPAGEVLTPAWSTHLPCSLLALLLPGQLNQNWAFPALSTTAKPKPQQTVWRGWDWSLSRCREC